MKGYLGTRASDDGGEHGAGSVVSGEPSLDQAGAVVAHEGGGFFVVAHLGLFWAEEGADDHLFVEQSIHVF